MIRMMFSVGDGGQTAKTFHSIALPDEKAKLLLQSTAVVIGFENCRELSYAEQIARVKIFAGKMPDVASESCDPQADGGIPIPPHLVPEIERLSSEDKALERANGGNAWREVCEPASFADQVAESLAKVKADAAQASDTEVEQALEDALRVEITAGMDRACGRDIKTKLWMLMRPSGEFVKSTTEEGGESYIACTSFEEAQKVAEQQKIYDIDCVPQRVF